MTLPDLHRAIAEHTGTFLCEPSTSRKKPKR